MLSITSSKLKTEGTIALVYLYETVGCLLCSKNAGIVSFTHLEWSLPLKLITLLWNSIYACCLSYAVLEAEVERYFDQILQNQMEMSRKGMEM